MTKITEKQRSVIVNALYTAAEKYRECAKEIAASDMLPDNRASLVECFNKQANDCSEVLNAWEE